MTTELLNTVNPRASESRQLRRDREKVWRGHVTGCDKCGAAANKLIYHEDGVQCFNCNHIIYMPEAAILAEMFPDPQAILREVAKQAAPPPPTAELENHLREDAMVESSIPEAKPLKPENWNKLGNQDRKNWYVSHRDEIIRDYQTMPYVAVLAKWGMSSSTLMKLRKEAGVETRRRRTREPKKPRMPANVKGKEVAVEIEVEPSQADNNLNDGLGGQSILVITDSDLAIFDDAEFIDVWTALGKIVRARTPYKGSKDGE